jgi:hypothetical protein
VLDRYERSQATGIIIPFNVEEAFGSRARVPVRGTINGFAFRSSVFPMGDGRHYMVINKGVREGARAKAGDTIKVVLQLDDEPRVIEPPDDFVAALKTNRAAKTMWDKLSYSHRRAHVSAIEAAKRPETRARRIKKAVADLAEGKKP